MSWAICAASVTGKQHQLRQEPNQDVVRFQIWDQFCLGVLADGAGSASKGALGAQLAVDISLNRYAEWIEQQAFAVCPSDENWFTCAQQLLQEIQESLNHYANRGLYSLTDLACTLLVFLATPNWLAGFQIGDSHLVLRQQEQDAYLLACKPMRGEYANETIFITSPEANSQIKTWIYSQSIGFIAAGSDGIEPVSLQYPDLQPFSGFYKTLDQWLQNSQADDLQQLEIFLASERLEQRTSDDRSLILAGWRL